MTDRRTMIIKNALHDINERGFYGASLNDIAKQSGISKATLFHYFRSKDELINEVFLHCKQVYLDAPVKGVLLYKFSDEEISMTLKFYLEHREELRFMHNNYYSEHIKDDVRNIAENMFKTQREELVQAQDKGEIVGLDVTFILLFIIHTILECLDRIFVDGEIDFEYTKKILTFMKNALSVQ